MNRQIKEKNVVNNNYMPKFLKSARMTKENQNHDDKHINWAKQTWV